MNVFLSLLFLFSFQGQAKDALLPPAGVPRVNLDYWNLDVDILWNNNCYNYSTNRVTNSFAQPGEASGEMYVDITCEDVAAAAEKDLGLIPATHFDLKNKNEETLIALVVAPDYDFHWYRRDDDKMWSHKPGATSATTLDESDEVIADPEKADRGFYTDFCGYFKVKNILRDTSEQNAGYVRIGNMSDLPEFSNAEETDILRAENSDVEILLYSGRENPRLPLEAFLNSEHAPQSLVQNARVDLERAGMGVLLGQNFPSRLGYNGLLIRDHQGLLFPKGTQVHVKGNNVIAYSNGRQTAAYSEVFSQLEEALKDYFSVVAK